MMNLCIIVLYFIVLYLSISTAHLTARAFQKRSRPQQLTLCRSLHAEALQATASEGIAQGHGSYVYGANRAGVQPAILRSKGIDSSNAASRRTMIDWISFHKRLMTALSDCGPIKQNYMQLLFNRRYDKYAFTISY